jgi:ERCC4-type nuclease
LIPAKEIAEMDAVAEPAVERRDVATLWPDAKFLRELKASRVVLINDSREQNPLQYENLPSVTRTLETADISIVGAEEEFAIERKGSLEDLANCCGYARVRFEKELRRLSRFPFCRLLIVSTEDAVMSHSYRSEVSPGAIMGSLFTWSVRYGIPFQFCSTPEEAARMVELYAYYFAVETVKKADNFLRLQKALC